MKNKIDKKFVINAAYTLLLIIAGLSLIAFWYFKYDYVPANRTEQYYLNGEEVGQDDLQIEVEYDVVMTDLDTGKVYHRPITYHDTTAPEITVDNSEFIYVRELSNTYYGLTITDNYYPLSEIQITMEGVDNTKIGEYNAIIKAEDGSHNYREINTTVKVVGDKYIKDDILLERDFSVYKPYTSRIGLSADAVFDNIVAISYADLQTKLANKENIAVFFGYRGCPWCEDAEPILNKTAEDLGVKIYMIEELSAAEDCHDEEHCELKSSETSKEEIIEWLKTLEDKDSVLVPYLAVFKEGVKAADYYNLPYLAYFRNLMPSEKAELEAKYAELLSLIADKADADE